MSRSDENFSQGYFADFFLSEEYRQGDTDAQNRYISSYISKNRGKKGFCQDKCLDQLFMTICMDGKTEMAKSLLNEWPHCFDPHAHNNYPLRVSASLGNADLLGCLIGNPDFFCSTQNNRFLPRDCYCAIISACANGHVDVVSKIFSSPFFNEFFYCQYTATECTLKACTNGQEDILRLLLEKDGFILMEDAKSIVWINELKPKITPQQLFKMIDERDEHKKLAVSIKLATSNCKAHGEPRKII